MQLGELEKKVMGVVWREYNERDFAVRDIVESTGKHYAYNTILTVISHLYKKNLLKRRKKGKAFVYTATCSKDEFVKHTWKSLLQNMRQAYGDVVLAHFADIAEEIDPAVIQRAKKKMNS